MAYLRSLQETSFWEGINLELLEDMRLRMRGLVQFLDKHKRAIVYTDFQDEIIGTREEEVLHIPKMTSVQYERKVAAYLKDHLSNIAIHRLRTNQPLTPSDLEGL